MTDSIQKGLVIKPYWLFLPYKSQCSLFNSEEEVCRKMPRYFTSFLEPRKAQLQSRASIVRSRRSDWWGLMHAREWSLHPRPRIISKFFGAEGAFVADLDDAYLTVMGHVWMLKPRSDVPLAPDVYDTSDEFFPQTELLAAYVGLCNSMPFVKLLSLYAPTVARGQFDLSARHVGPIPVPDLQLMSLAPDTGRAVRELAALGREVRLPSSEWEYRASALAAYLYGGVEFDAV